MIIKINLYTYLSVKFSSIIGNLAPLGAASVSTHKITDDNFRQYAIIHSDNLSVKFSSIIGNLAPLGAASVNAHNITDDNLR